MTRPPEEDRMWMFTKLFLCIAFAVVVYQLAALWLFGPERGPV